MKKTSRRTSASPPRSRSSPSRASATRRGPATGHVPAAAAEVILAFARAASKARRRWYLFGAQAVAVYGVQRASADVDVTVLASPAEVAPLIVALRAESITLRIDDPGFIAATRVLPVVHAASGWPADVVLGGPGLEELFADAARQMKVGRSPAARRIWRTCAASFASRGSSSTGQRWSRRSRSSRPRWRAASSWRCSSGSNATSPTEDELVAPRASWENPGMKLAPALASLALVVSLAAPACGSKTASDESLPGDGTGTATGAGDGTGTGAAVDADLEAKAVRAIELLEALAGAAEAGAGDCATIVAGMQEVAAGPLGGAMIEADGDPRMKDGAEALMQKHGGRVDKALARLEGALQACPANADIDAVFAKVGLFAAPSGDGGAAPVAPPAVTE